MAKICNGKIKGLAIHVLFVFIFAQGFSLKMQLLNEQIKFLIGFVRFFESKTLNTLILDTFASENTMKPMFFCIFGFWTVGYL